MPSTHDQLADKAEIIDTVIAYATAVDTRDWELFESLHIDGAVWTYQATGERHSGPAAILARVRPAIERLHATQHLNTNHVITLDGDEAAHRCYYLAQHIRRDTSGGEKFLAAGTYEDRLHRTPAGWRFSSRTIVSTWSEGNPAVVQP